ncbi:DUF4012 domain-containing protein [Microbacterium memoriense]|uniref:DUF4012 domain-containing protein n=1 Tax=Microbacterium memoriense TaxID=2978350 RepID=A0ABT2PDR8_9MICO|nr:DUF4012 domain-containing protein [Microbacterium memoriense]MCT9001949.1 DUF4012 domain-containing protein [Microbacterium memoriense]
MTAPVLPPAARTAGRIFVIALGACLLAVIAIAGWIGVRGAEAYGHVRAVQDGTSDAIAALSADPAAASTTLEGLAAHAAAARDLTSDPIWRLGESVPWIGPQLSAFATVAAGLDAVLTEGLTPIARSAGGLSLDALKPVDGRIDPAPLATIAEPARAGADAVARSSARIHAIDTVPLAGVVADAVRDADAQFAEVATATDALARAAALLPGMLGQDGPRTYLVIVQNNAEWRSLGGIAGAGVLLHTEDGVLTLSGTLSSTDFPSGFPDPVAPLSDEIVALFDTKPARYIQNTTQIPDFAVGAPLAAEMVRSETGLTVDGVLAVDPVVLSYLLDATGPVTVPTGDVLTADNAVSLLLNEVYFRYDKPADQDAFFSAAAGAVFDALARGTASPGDLVSALGQAGAERRLLLWSADPDEQLILADTTLAGPLPTTNDQTAQFGVYLNEGGGSKMSYYTHPSVQLAWNTCAPSETVAARSLTLTLTLESTAPADAATSLPPYLTADGAFGTAPGDSDVVGNIYLPTGYELTESSLSTGGGFGGGMHDGRQVLTLGVVLAPGASATATVTVRAVTGADHAEALVTPTADADLATTVSAGCGALG